MVQCARCTSNDGRFVCEPCNHGFFCDLCRVNLSDRFSVCPCCPADAEPIARFKIIATDNSHARDAAPRQDIRADIRKDNCKSLLINASPEDVVRRKDFATELYKAGKFFEALSTLSSCINDSALLPKQLASVIYANRSLALMALNRFSEALADAEQALLLDGSNVKAQFRMAKASLELGDYQRAEHFAEKVYRATGDLAAQEVIDAVTAKIRMKPVKEYPVKGDENVMSNVQLPITIQKPTGNQISNARDLESLITSHPASDTLLSKLPPDCLAWHISNSAHVFSDPDIFVSIIMTLDTMTDNDAVCQYMKQLQACKHVSTVVAMLTSSERKVYNKLVLQSR